MRTWPALLVLLALTATVLSGCLSSSPDDGPDTTPGTGTTAAYALDCTISHWDEPCLAHASPNDSPSKTEINLVVNPTDPLNIVVASKDKDPLATPGCVWSVAQVTHDGGHTWTTSYIGGTISERRPGDLLYNYECVTDPIMTFNKDGDLFYNIQAYRQTGEPDNMGLPGPDAALMALAISHDGGDTWSEFIAEEVGDDVAIFPDYMHMGANPQTGTVFAAWNTIVGLTTSNPTMYRYDGNPLATPMAFPSADSPTGYGASSIVGATDGTMYFCICSFNSGSDAASSDPAGYVQGSGMGGTWWSVSTNDGLTWSTPTLEWTWAPTPGKLSNAEFRTGTTVEVAIDNSGGPDDGCLYAVWNGRDMTQDEGDVYVRRSCNGGDTWTDAMQINNHTSDGAQIMANVAVDGHGGIHALYLTQHYSGNNLLDAEWAHSTDGGTTWDARRLTTHSFDGDLGIHQNGFPFLGDYIGIDAAGDDIYMGFPTTFTGRAEIAVAHVQYQA